MEKAKPKRFLDLWKFLHKNFNRERTYILPTFFGLIYGLFSIVFIGIAYAFTNNAIYFMAFYMVALGLVTMIFCNRNVEQFKVNALRMGDVFVGEPGILKLNVSNLSKWTLYEISISLTKRNKKKEFIGKVILEKFEPLSQLEVKVPVEFKERGYQEGLVIEIESTFPFSFLKSWKKIPISKIIREESLLVYPSRIGTLPMLEKMSNQGHLNFEEKLVPSADGFFIGHRPYQSFDSFRQIDWKAYARNQQLLVKQYEFNKEDADLEVYLNWEDTETLSDFESRISQMTFWIVECEKKFIKYQLRMGSWKGGSALSRSSYTDCLRKLALVKQNEI